MNIDDIILNSGYAHIKDEIFEHLDNPSLSACLRVSKKWHETLKRLRLRRHLLWLMTFSRFNVSEHDAEWHYYKRSSSFLQVFPEWIKLSKHFKSKGTVEDIEEVIQILKLYIAQPDYRVELENKGSPIQFAAENGYIDFLKILVPVFIELKLNHFIHREAARYRSDDKPPILLTCESGHTEIVKFFLEQKDTETEYSHEFKNQCLHAACKNGHLDIVKLFDQELANLRKPLPIFHAACESGNLDLVLYLIQESEKLTLDLNLLDKNGNTALHNACAYGLADVVNVLLDTGAWFGAIDANPMNKRNETIFHSACLDKGKDGTNLKMVKLLFKRSKEIGLDLNQQTNYQETAFHYACRNGLVDVVKFMIENAEEFLFTG